MKAVIVSCRSNAGVNKNHTMTVWTGWFRVHTVDASPRLSSPSHPGPHLLLLGVAVVLRLRFTAAVEAPHQAVPVRLQSVLHPLTHVSVGRLGRGAFGHCWPTIVEPRRSLACRSTAPCLRCKAVTVSELGTFTTTALQTLTHTQHTHTLTLNTHSVEPEHPDTKYRKSTPINNTGACGRGRGHAVHMLGQKGGAWFAVRGLLCGDWFTSVL